MEAKEGIAAGAPSSYPASFALHRLAVRAAGKVDESFALESEAESAYVGCWGTHIREAAAYPALVQQAQRVADSLASDQ